MKRFHPLALAAALPAVALLFPPSPLAGQEVGFENDEFVYTVGEVNYLTGDGVSPGGFLFPSLFVTGTGGVFDGSSEAEDYATHEHDPQNDLGFQYLEMHMGINFDDVITGMVAALAHHGHDHEWELELEEIYLHLHLNDWLSIGGGQFLNSFGFQNHVHIHEWFFVNQNLINSRMLGDADLITQGAELIYRPSSAGRFTFGVGNARSHSHGHGHGHHDDDDDDDHHHHDDDDHDDDHHGEIDPDEAFFEDVLATLDYRFRLPFDDNLIGSASFGIGENGFDRNTYLYGVGLRKVWNGQTIDLGAPDFRGGTLMAQAEFIGREVKAVDEDDEFASFSDYGFSSALHYGLSDRCFVSFRHDWISGVEIAELDDRHRLSAALTAFVDQGQRVRARVQYDYTPDNHHGGEHAAWFQLQIQWGGIPGFHHDHTHY